ncbi:conjugative transposon protein TraM [Rubrolithibacter danxiaensis]|uniref:conjugative transposon protein TraM n=1 Tax=Rubrolithibacter danxiaensis TaxID=3390805 RepID=UPI003BF7DAF9
MEKRQDSPKFLRQRKFFTILPLLVLPFITVIFWLLGGGKTSTADAHELSQLGFNMQLPGAYLKEDKPLDKLSYYERAASDSAKLKEQMKNDPYYNYRDTDSLPLTGSLTEGNGIRNNSSRINTSPFSNTTYQDANETKVYEKLEQLNKVLNRPPSVQKQASNKMKGGLSQDDAEVNSNDIDRLEQMMQVMNQGEEEDPEMQQLNGMLEKILDIQHPERVQEKLRTVSEARKGQVFAVSVDNLNDAASLLSSHPRGDNANFRAQSKGFFSIENSTDLWEIPNAVRAVIHETQTLVSGSTIKFRLVDDVYINGALIPKDHFIFGIASLNGERLTVSINSIRYNNSIFPVELSVYDMDGLNGIYIPGAITRDAAKQSADRVVQGIGLTTLDPSLGAQAASAGIDAARTLFSKKVKQVKVTVKAGYQVLLLDEKQNLN